MFFVAENNMAVNPEEKELKKKSLRFFLALGIASIIMLFAGLTSAYIVRQGKGKWVEFDLPQLFIFSTIVIVLSSISIEWALRAVKKNDIKKLRIGLLITVVLGFGFLISQYYAWADLYHHGIAFRSDISDIKPDMKFEYIPSIKNESLAEAQRFGNVAGSFLYVITGLHVIHLLAGMIALIIVFSRAFAGRYSLADYNGVKMCTTYWHFLSGLWLYLFFFLLYIR